MIFHLISEKMSHLCPTGVSRCFYVFQVEEVKLILYWIWSIDCCVMIISTCMPKIYIRINTNIISNDKILPLSELSNDNQKLVIFDDFLNIGAKNDAEIKNYFTNSRNKNCSCIYLSQSFYNTDKTIRLNCTHYFIF